MKTTEKRITCQNCFYSIVIINAQLLCALYVIPFSSISQLTTYVEFHSSILQALAKYRAHGDTGG